MVYAVGVPVLSARDLQGAHLQRIRYGRNPARKLYRKPELLLHIRRRDPCSVGCPLGKPDHGLRMSSLAATLATPRNCKRKRPEFFGTLFGKSRLSKTNSTRTGCRPRGGTELRRA